MPQNGQWKLWMKRLTKLKTFEDLRVVVLKNGIPIMAPKTINGFKPYPNNQEKLFFDKQEDKNG